MGWDRLKSATSAPVDQTIAHRRRANSEPPAQTEFGLGSTIKLATAGWSLVPAQPGWLSFFPARRHRWPSRHFGGLFERRRSDERQSWPVDLRSGWSGQPLAELAALAGVGVRRLRAAVIRLIGSRAEQLPIRAIE